ncbi:MAG: transcriptional repressor [Bacteroidota bacterium]
MGTSRRTKSSIAIEEHFEQNERAFSVVELVELFADSMNKSTVYRILERLEERGKIHSFLGMNGLKWFAKCQGCTSEEHIDVHPHFQCKECKQITCIPVASKIPVIENHTVESASILLVGRCDACLD